MPSRISSRRRNRTRMQYPQLPPMAASHSCLQWPFCFPSDDAGLRASSRSKRARGPGGAVVALRVSCSERVQHLQPSPRAYFAVNEGYRSVMCRNEKLPGFELGAPPPTARSGKLFVSTHSYALYSHCPICALFTRVLHSFGARHGGEAVARGRTRWSSYPQHCHRPLPAVDRGPQS